VIALPSRNHSPIADQQLATIAQVAAGLSHESRAALQRISASAEMLELELGGNPTALKHVAQIQQSQMHMHRLLEDLRSYAAPEPLDCSPVRISEIWREAWRSLQPQRKARQARVCEHISAKELLIEADYFRLVQLFRNLLENSLAAATDPVRIDVLCEEVNLGAVPAVRVIVRDNGPGFDRDQRTRIFEPFYTTKPTGTGLGMAIAQRIVKAHGGIIAVGNNPLPGAEIVIELPR